MNKILLFISTALFFICTATGARAQCEDLTITGQGIDITQPQVCAPVTITLSASYTLLSVEDPAKVQIRVYWNDGVSDYETLPAAETSPGSKTFRITKDKEYAAGPNCAYEPETFLVYDGRLCASSRQAQKFSAWSTDDTNPGPVAIDPEEAEFCPNSAIDGFVFFDNTTFNCNIDIEPDKPNRLTRWVQFVYNTDPNNGSLIREVTVNGTQLTDANGNFLDQLEGVIDALPAPADGPVSSSLPISAPAGSPVGAYFEITLRNWNVCNPYDDPNIPGPPADPVNGDFPPVETTARLVIVAEPQPQLTAPADVCLEEGFTLGGAATGANNNFLEYRWQVYDDEEGNQLLTESNNKNFDFEGFTAAGRKLVRLRVRRTDTMDNGCWGETTSYVRVSEAPQIEVSMNGEAVNSLDFCFEPEAPVQQVAYTHRLRSDNSYTYTYKLFKRNSSSAEPDSTHAALVPVSKAAGQEANASYMAEYSRPGQYKVWVVAVDNVTSCETISESVTTIYGKPVPAFTASELCEGQETAFTNTSSLPVVINNDQITGYLWNFGDGSGTSTDESPSYTYTTAGSYEVSLQLTTKGGCTTELKKQVTVNQVPKALLDTDYTEPICPGKIAFTNLSLALNNAAFGEGTVTYTLVRSDGSTEESLAFEGEEKEFIFSNTTSSNVTYQVWLKAVADGCEQLSDPITIEVLPGAEAGFFEPNYKAANINCSVFDFTFVVNQATLNLGAEKHHWEIYKNGEKTEDFTFLPGDEGFEVLEYTAVNNDEVSARYEVILVPEKSGLCIQTAVNAYRIYPQPIAEDIQLEISNECEFSFVHVKVNGGGIRNYNWNIDQLPENATEITYDDDFVLVYKRPEVGVGALPVNISLTTDNFFGCRSDEMQPAGGTVLIPEKVINEVRLELANPGDEKGCSPLTVGFINATNAPEGTSYELYVQHGISEKQLVEVEGDINSSDPFSYTFTNPGLYSVSMKAVAPDGCSLFSETSLAVEVYGDPKPYFNIENREGCAPLSISVQKNIQQSVSNRWFITDLSSNTTVEEEDISIYPLINNSDEVKSYEIKLVSQSAGGCMADSSMLVQVYPAIEADFEIVAGEELCQPFEITVKNTSVNPEGTTYSWKWGDGTSVDSNEAALSHSYTNPSYRHTLYRNITLTAVTPEGCESTVSRQLSILPQVRVAVTPNVTEGCAPLQVLFRNNSEGITDHYWEVREKGSTGAPLYTATTAVPDLPALLNEGDAAKVYEVLYTGQNAAGCTGTSLTEINVKPAAEALFSMDNDASVCTASEITFVNENIKPGVRYIWRWNDGEPNDTTTTEAGITHTFFNTSISRIKQYEVTLTALSPDGGCSSIYSKTVEVNPAIFVQVSPDKTEGCAPLQVNFRNNSAGITAHYWEVREKGSTGDPLYTATTSIPDMPGLINDGSEVKVYEVLYSGSNDTGCSDSVITELRVFPGAEALFSKDYDTADCAETTVSFTNMSVKPGVQYVWNWNDGEPNDTTTTEAVITHTFVNTSTTRIKQYEVRLTALSAGGACTDIYRETVEVNPALAVKVLPNVTEGCAPLQVSYRNNSEGIENHYWEVREKGTTGTPLYTAATAVPDIPGLLNNGSEVKIYEVRYTGSNASGCSATSLSELRVLPGSEALFSMDYNDDVCSETEVTFTNLDIKPGIRYIWRWNDGLPNDTTTTESTIKHIFSNNTTTQAKQYEVTLTALNPLASCANTYSQTVRVNPKVALQVSPDKQEGCAPLEVNFGNQSRNVASNYWYARLAGTQEREQEQTVAEASFRFGNTTTGPLNYEVVYVGTSADGCAETTVQQVQVFPALQASFTTDSVRVRLPNSTFNITNETLNAEAWTHHWDFGDGSSSDAVHPGSHTYGTYGRFTITLTVSNGVCSETYSQEVTVNEILPIVDFESIPVAGCWPLEVNFVNNSQFADPNTYYWDFGDGEGFSRAVNPSYTYFKPGEYTVTLSASNPSGEVVSTSYAIVTVYERPRVNFEVRETVVYVPGDPVYVANHTRGAVSYTWDFGDGTTYNAFEPVHYYKEPGVYTITLMVQNEWGCADTLVRQELVTAEAGGQAKIPNAFTPNSSGPGGGNIDTGNNDVFFPILEGGIRRYNMKIYNRWGELLFETNEQQIGWDGYYKGSLCKADVYVYKLSVEYSDGKTLNKLGDVTLIR